MSDVLACDPGLNITGLAHFQNGYLVNVWRVGKTQEKSTKFDKILRNKQLLKNIKKEQMLPLFDVLVIEHQQIYNHYIKKEADPNDLLYCALMNGLIIQEFEHNALQAYLPADWKKQVPKQIHNLRVQKRLTPEEQLVLNNHKHGQDHNIIDAVGLGLFFLGRGA